MIGQGAKSLSMNPSFLSQIATHLSPHHIQTEHVSWTQQDASSQCGVRPAAVLFPTHHHQIIEIVKLANLTQTPLVCRGAGTGTTGAALPLSQNTVVVSLEKLNQIIEIDTQNRMAVVQPGVITGDLHRAVEAVGLFYPPDPASLNTCTLGGNVAVNAGGPRAYKYGVTRHYVLGLKGVWANGDPFDLGGKLIKNVTGYDLIGLLVGSEGTLGVITEITLKLIPKPKYTCHIAFGFEDEAKAIHFAQTLPLLPAASEWIEKTGLQASAENGFPLLPYSFLTLFELEGSSQSDLDSQISHLAVSAQNQGGQRCPYDPWQLRQTMSSSLRKWAKNKQSHDVVIPPACILDYLKHLRQKSEESGFILLGYGHIGDGNIHVNILNRTHSEESWQAALPELTQFVITTALQMGGGLSGEHGIGITKRAFLDQALSPTTRDLMNRLKAQIDPNHILNPHKAV
jgi:glycolate oxidase subunit GlcD